MPPKAEDVHEEAVFNPYPANLLYLNFHPLEVVSRYRDPQLQVGENYSNMFNLGQNIYISLCLTCLKFKHVKHKGL